MSEPTSSISGIAIGTGVITLTGSVLGLQWDALLLGLFGGLFSLQHLPPLRSKWQIASSLASAAFLGAALSPFAEAFLREYVKWASTVSGDTPRLAFAAMIGMGAQVLVPFFLSKVSRKVEAS